MNKLSSMYKTLLHDEFPQSLTLEFGGNRLVYAKRTWLLDGETKSLRYGENPDQPAALYELTEGQAEAGGVTFRQAGEGIVSAVTEAQMIQAGKHPGKTNLTDVDNGVYILLSLQNRPAAVILKHNNPSGAAWSHEGIAVALYKAYMADRIAAFGGAVVVNRPLDKAAADVIASSYFEVVAAPDFEEGALDMIRKRKNLRIFRFPQLGNLSSLAGRPFLEIKTLCDGGLIIQQSFMNRIHTPEDFLQAEAMVDGKTVSARRPSQQEMDDLLFAWAVESGVISNSIIFAAGGATVAIGAGEQDRVGCVEIAAYKAFTKYADRLAFEACGLSLYELRHKAREDKAFTAILQDLDARTRAAHGGMCGSVMVSDGFFPFRDGADAALGHGVTAIAQPGGSLRDAEVIQAVRERDAAMVFTGQRAFKH